MYKQLVHTWLFGPVDLSSTLASLVSVGADGIDLSVTLNGEYNGVSVLKSQQSAQKIYDSGLPVEVVTAVYKSPNLDFSHPNEAVGETVVSFTCDCIDLACQYNAKRVLVVPSLIAPYHPYHIDYETDWNQSVERLKRVAEYAREKDIILMIEPITRYVVGLVRTVEEGLRMVEDVGSPALRLSPDAFHMNMEESSGVAARLATLNGNQLGCFHLGDNNRKPPSYGCLDWMEILRNLIQIGFDGALSHEPVELGFSEEKMATDKAYREKFEQQLKQSISYLRQCMEQLGLEQR